MIKWQLLTKSLYLDKNIPLRGGAWNLIKTVTLEENTAYIIEELGGQYNAVLLMFENLWSTNKTGVSTSISFNGLLPSSISNSFSGGLYINSSSYPSSGFYEVELLEDGCARVITGGLNSAGNRATGNETGLITPSYMNNKNYFDKVAFSVSGYATNQMNTGAIITIYAR